MNIQVAPTVSADALPRVPSQVDVLIVGLGPVGAVMANLLGRHGVKTLVIDKAAEIFKAPRAIALDNEALRILQLAGLAEDAFDTIAIPFVRMRCPIVGDFARINTLGTIDGFPKQVTFYQPQLETVLRGMLTGMPAVTVSLETELSGFTETDNGVIAHLRSGTRTFDIRTRYLVGADGAGSIVRQLIGEQFNGKTYAEDWLVVDAQRDPPGIDHIEFLCDHKRPVPHMIAPGNRERWEFMLRKGERREEVEREENVRKLLGQWDASGQMSLERKAVYRFHARVARQFSKGSVFLIGDAAHITPPFVGQGLVAGLRDAANLSWKLAWAVQGHAGASILKTYDQERRPHAIAMINLAKFMGKLIMPRNAFSAFLNHGLMRMVRHLPFIGDFFEELEIKPQNRFKSGLFRKSGAKTKLEAGALIPQGWVRARDGRIALSDEALGSGFALVGFGCDPVAKLDPETARRLAGLNVRSIQIAYRGQRLGLTANDTYEDLEGRFLPGIAKAGMVAVIRPDRIIMHSGPADDVTRIVTECLDLLQMPVRANAELA
ncbi:bifunctional 3-(3-hydroxy-phenyl)propionate/3-hydroxycinnamic acid hydroxylase [Rhizobium sp. C4]|uniref:bifunctional 3-(3-hydroxy-phenyl)propionate/3-hydroxycinnamic acid hydroxylase n=1 Tax=Rhizobium sp. C4 TaxID=1349800 RepID=UPI001E3631EC|nr:bifunctional 3-(3-hydroxy-phenyl)propionate/3-hydroxycinnamic acid hydroxylase [Rhizobium sp. C4]MCD2175507.1 bifunctional 3-(3-hydroxy-phenyl)propionate/3-hydroxycinnamic acid hydroxylase [Rhizobium sp. C4]